MNSVAQTRQISTSVYNKIKASGVLTGLREKVFDYIYKNGPVTIAQALRDIPSKRDSSINARFSELRRMGAIEQVGTVPDPTGGGHVISLWDLTGNVPVELKDDRAEFFIVIYTLAGKRRRGVRDTIEDATCTPDWTDIYKVKGVKVKTRNLDQ